MSPAQEFHALSWHRRTSASVLSCVMCRAGRTKTQSDAGRASNRRFSMRQPTSTRSTASNMMKAKGMSSGASKNCTVARRGNLPDRDTSQVYSTNLKSFDMKGSGRNT